MEDMFMEKSKVYFTDFRTRVGVSLTEKLQRLIKKAGITDIDMDGKFVAIKMHFGELGNLSYLRPNYAKAVADVVKECGGKPFLTDCNTLYPGSRKNALEHLDCANINGFNTITTGCQIIIGDGLRGTDDITVPVRNGEYCKEAYIGRAVMDADIFISLTHFKGHESTGFGGAIKNIGMGCGSRAGKMQQHNSGKPIVHDDYVEDVVAVLKNVAAMQSLMKMVKQSSIRISVKDVADVLVPAHLMRLKIRTGMPMKYLVERWLSIRRQYVMEDQHSILV